jgi:hypothetical protein
MLGAIRRCFGRFLEVLLGLADDLLHGKKAVGAYRDRVNAMLYQETCKLGMITGCLTANSSMPADFPRGGEQLGDCRGHDFVALIEQRVQSAAVAVDAQYQLGEIVGTD